MTARKQGHAPARKHSSTGANPKNSKTASTASKRSSRSATHPDPKRYLIVAVLVVAAFLGAYSVSRASNGGATATAVAPTAVNTTLPAGAIGAAPDGTAISEPAGAADAVTTADGVQKAAVQVGFDYQPGVIRLKAGVPAEITFSQAQGCTGQVQSQALGFQEDLTTGAKTVKLKGLKPGTYQFACGMDMVRGQIVVS